MSPAFGHACKPLDIPRRRQILKGTFDGKALTKSWLRRHNPSKNLSR